MTPEIKNRLTAILLAAGYSLHDDIEPFIARWDSRRLLWEEFQRRANAYSKIGMRRGAIGVLEDIRSDPSIPKTDDYKANNNLAPYFATLFNAKYRTDYFEQRAKGRRAA